MNIYNKIGKKVIIIMLLTLVTSVFYTPKISIAQSPSPASTGQPSTYTLLEPLPCIPGEGVVCKEGEMKKTVDFREYVQYAVNLMIAIAAVSAVFMIVVGGFQYMTTDSWQGKGDGVKKVKNAVYGLLLILSSYLILRTIDPRLVEIPATLVPQLTLDYDKNGVNEFMDELSAEAARYGAETAALKAQRDESKKTAEDLTLELYEIQDEMGAAIANGNEAEYEKLKLEASRIDDRIDAANSLAASQTYTANLKILSGYITSMKPEEPGGIFDRIVNGTSYRENNVKAIDTLQGLITAEYRRGLTKLESISNPANSLAKSQIELAYQESLAVIAKKRADFRIK